MSYKIVGRWGSISPTAKDANIRVRDAFNTYKTDYYGSGPDKKYVFLSSYDLDVAASVLASMSPKNRIDVVRVEVDNFILVTLAIQIQHLHTTWSASGSICLEEMVEVLREKDPSYYKLFMYKLEGAA